jgi:pimeloyl-ACP methyl ester carboxylesterase
MNRWLASLAVALSAIALLLATGGQTYRWVDAGGHSLRISERGHGGPTVVFEAGAGSPLEAWILVQPQVSRFTTTIAYDRAGNGLSPKGPTPRDGRNVASELHTMLLHAGASPPYLLVGHSLGGPYIRAFVDAYPNEVAGLVLVDPTQEELIAWAKAREHQPPQSHPPRLEDEVDCAPLTFAELTNSQIPPSISVILITGLGPREAPGFASQDLRRELQKDQETLYPAKLNFHKAWVEKAARGRLVITRESGHGIPWEEPQLIVHAIREIVEQVRAARNSTSR